MADFLSISSGVTSTGLILDNNVFAVVSSCGMLSDTTVNSSGAIFLVRSGASAADTTINYGGKMYVSFGLADVVTVNPGGRMYVSGDGTATRILENGGYVDVLPGATVTFVPHVLSGLVFKDGDEPTIHSGTTGIDLTLNNSGRLYVRSGGTASNTTVINSGSLLVSSGGTAIGATVNDGGTVDARLGGTATDITVNNGGELIVSRGTATGATINNGGRMNVSSGAANNTKVSYGGRMSAGSGGTATDTSVDSGGKLLVFFSGTATGTMVNSGGNLLVSGGTARNTTVKSDGYLYVSGTATDTMVNSGGSINVHPGGKVTGKFTLEKGALISGHSGSILDFSLTQTAPGADVLVNDLSPVLNQQFSYTLTVADLQADGTYTLAAGAAGFDRTITVMNPLGEECGTITVADGTKMIRNREYTLSLDESVLAVTVKLIPDLTGDLTGSFDLTSGMIAKGVNIKGEMLLKRASLYISSGGFASMTTVKANGVLDVSSGGAVDNTTVSSGGRMNVSSGGAANNTKVDYGGSMYVSSGGTASSITVVAGSVTIAPGGAVDNTTVSSGGRMLVISGVVDNTTVYAGGRMWVEDSGTAGNTTVSSGGYMSVYGGGAASNITVYAGGSMTISSGGTATGKMSFADNAVVSAFEGSFIDFNVSGVAPGNDPFVNNLSIVQGTPAYTLTVDGAQAEGTYKLAEGAVGFDKTITVVNTSGTTLGTLTVNGGTQTIGGFDYTLTLTSGGTLDITIAKTKMVLSGDLFNYTFNLGTGLIASNVNILSKGRLNVESDALASRTTVNGSGTLCVYEGGVAKETTVNPGGMFYIKGEADATTVNYGGNLHVSSAGKATNVTENGGYVTADEGSVVEFVPNEFTRLTLESGIWATVHSGTTATDTNIGYEGGLTVFYGGSARNTVVAETGLLEVYGGGKAEGVSVASGGMFGMAVGGSATGIVAADGAFLALVIAPDTCAKGTYGGKAFEATDTLSDYTVHAGGWLEVYDGGSADDITVDCYGNLAIYGTGKATQVRENGGYVYVDGSADVKFVANTFSGVYVAWTATTVHSGTTAIDTTVGSNGEFGVFSGGVASGVTVASTGHLFVFDGGRITGKLTFEDGAIFSVSSGAVLDLDLAKTTAGADTLVNDFSFVKDQPFIWTLTVGGSEAAGDYKLAGGAAGFDKTITVKNASGAELGTLTLGKTANIGGVGYTLNLDGDNVLSVTVGEAAPTSFVAKGDRDGNGVSDVMFVWTGEHGEGNHAHGYWMNGTSEWWSANAPGVSPDWDNLGSYDMSGDGKADAVMFGNVIVNEARGAYIGYYQDGNDMDGWVTIGFLDNAENIEWQNKVGNLTGNASGVNSIVWYAPELYALGVWKDGTTDWYNLSSDFGGADWTLAGCGDFNGDGTDSVLMSYNKGQTFYTIGIDDGAPVALGSLDWRGWEIRAIGDFAGDGKDDIVLFHHDTGSMVMCEDGDFDNFKSIGQLAANDWFVVGAGDYNGDQKDDLLVRQYSSGMLGYYISADQSQWVELGRGVDMDWTVIA